MNKIVITWKKAGTWRPYIEISSNEQIRLYVPKNWKIKHNHSEEA